MSSGTLPGGLLDRFLARLIDGVLLGVVFFVLSFIAGAIAFASGSSLLFKFVVYVLFGLLSLGYYAYLESARGQTLGKQLLKLRTVGAAGGNPTMEEALKRNLWMGLPILMFIPLLGFVASLGMLIAEIMIAVTINNDPINRQGWHDQFAGGTRVLKEA